MAKYNKHGMGAPAPSDPQTEKTPCPCRYCGREPVVVKVKPLRWRVACPYLDCKYVDAVGETEEEAVDSWNKSHGRRAG